jgi:hypothetical protein
MNRNNVTFVTFNYDVSLERRLFEIFNTTQFLKGDHVFNSFVEDRILHIYGKVREAHPSKYRPIDRNVFALSPLPLYGNRREAFAAAYKDALNTAFDASKGIRTIGLVDKAENKDTIERAKRVIKDANCVFVLGYGFDSRNSELIGMTEFLRVGNSNKFKCVLFTNYKDSNLINKKISQLLHGSYDQYQAPGPVVRGDLRGHYYCEKSVRDVYGALELDFDAVEELTIGPP